MSSTILDSQLPKNAHVIGPYAPDSQVKRIYHAYVLLLHQTVIYCFLFRHITSLFMRVYRKNTFYLFSWVLSKFISILFQLMIHLILNRNRFKLVAVVTNLCDKHNSQNLTNKLVNLQLYLNPHSIVHTLIGMKVSKTFVAAFKIGFRSVIVYQLTHSTEGQNSNSLFRSFVCICIQYD